jgi:hypothetical protein
MSLAGDDKMAGNEAVMTQVDIYERNKIGR